MSDSSLDFWFFLNERVTRTKFESLYHRIIRTYRKAIAEPSIEKVIETSYDRQSSWDAGVFFGGSIQIDRVDKIPFYTDITNWEKDRIHPPFIGNGERQIYGSIYSAAHWGPMNALLEKPNRAKRYIDLFTIIGDELDAFLGVISYYTAFYFFESYLPSLGTEYLQELDESTSSFRITEKLREALEERKIHVDADTHFKCEDRTEDHGRWMISTKDKDYKVELLFGKISICDYTDISRLRGYEYVEKILLNGWAVFFFDDALAEDVGLEFLKEKAMTLRKIDDKGYYIDFAKPLGFGRAEKYRSKDFYHVIAPKIKERMRREFLLNR